MLRYYWGEIHGDKKRPIKKFGYLDRTEIRIRKDGKKHKSFRYCLNQRGDDWLDRNTPGFEPLIEEREKQLPEGE
jgi:hypothetical protein